MATTYNTAFGSLPGYNEMLGTTNTTGGGQQNVYGQRAQAQRNTTTQGQAAPAQTFAQLQRQGMARPAQPTAPQAQAFAQYGGSADAQQMRQRLQQQLQQFGEAPSRFDTQAFQQIRGAQAANLQSEYQAQQQQLNEELARRGLSASSIGGGRMGDLAGQQARALASLDAQLLQQAAETQAQDRAALLQAGQGFAELAGAQDLAQFEANRVAQAATFENQLRAAQFGQAQYEQAGQEALQGAQAEEAAQQAARQFDLAATGQVGQLSLELQRLLGQQELDRAQLTGQLGGAQTLAGQQLAEQRRQFDIEQALRQQLGLGQLGVSQQELALRQQQLNEEARQFGLTLTEQQAARLQQYGISVQELGLETQRVQNQADQFGRTLSAQEAQNLAQNNLEQQRITNQAAQFTQQAAIQQGSLTGMFGGALTQDALQNAYARAAQLSQITGQQYTVNEQTGAVTPVSGADTLSAQLQRAGLTGQLGGQATLERLQQNLQQAQVLSQITGQQYTIDPATGALRASGGLTETARQTNLEAELRRQLGLTEASGFIYDLVGGTPTRTDTETVQGQIARSQTLMALANALSGLTPEQISNLLGNRTGTTSSTGSGSTGTTSSGVTTTTAKGGVTGVTTTTTTSEVNKPPTNPTEGQLWTDSAGRTYRWTNGQWVLQTSTTTTAQTGATTTTTAGQTTTTAGPTTTTAGPTTTTASVNVTTASPTISGVLTSLYPYAFNGMYKDIGTSSGVTWYQYQNGQWVVATQPPTTSVKDPSNTFNVNAYPGMTMGDGTGKNYYWNGTSWVLA